MLVYRIGKEQYGNDLSGYGAKLFGGRWNSVGTACVYTSQSRALALLEYLVNTDMDLVPPKLVFSIIEIQDSSIKEIELDCLPFNWKLIPAPSSTKLFGSNLIDKQKVAIYKVPSVVIPSENNYILSPKFINENCFKVVAIEPYNFDERLK